MRCEVGLIIKWRPCDTGDTSIKTMEEVMEYIQTTVESNARFDHVDLRIESAGVAERDDDNEEENYGN